MGCNKLVPGVNDLLTINPGLAAEWDYKKNGDMRPDTVAANSTKKAWWLCKKGHSWQVAISNRNAGSGCPYCGNCLVLAGFNDLGTKNPTLAAEWDYEKNVDICPEMVAANSGKKAWWLCKQGHSWQAAIFSRNAGCGCPYCANRLVLAGYNDLGTKNPTLAAEWDYEKNGDMHPETVTADSGKKAWWLCEKGHSWQAVIFSRNVRNGCPYCGNNFALAGFNDLSTKNPTLATEWDHKKNGNLKPTDVVPTSHRKVWWLGFCGHSWKSQVANRNNGNGCPYCAGVSVLKGFNDLLTVKPELCKEWDYEKNGNLTPDELSWGSSRSVWWKCSHGHSWKRSISGRRKGSGCPYCANKHPVIGVTDLQTVYPHLAAEWDYEKNKNSGLEPTEVTYSCPKKVWWRCCHGHSWAAQIYTRHKGSGCPVCSRKIIRHPVIVGQNDLKTVNPALAAEWDYERNGDLTPDQVRPYSRRKVWWRCQNGHRFRGVIQSRMNGARCPYCMGRIPMRSRIVK